jgi:hypothetical protein
MIKTRLILLAHVPASTAADPDPLGTFLSQRQAGDPQLAGYHVAAVHETQHILATPVGAGTPTLQPQALRVYFEN